MTKRQQSSREKALRRYFRRSASRASWMLGLGILLLVGGFVLADATEGASLLPGAALVILWILVLFLDSCPVDSLSPAMPRLIAGWMKG